MQTDDILCIVVKSDNLELTKTLIGSAANVNYIDKEGKRPLYHAYENNKIAQMKILISYGAGINKKYKGETILNRACREFGEEMIVFLMENGADPNIYKIANSCSFPLLELVSRNNIDLLIKLLSYPNVDINLQNNFGVTPLILACKKGFSEISMVLLDKGANQNIQTHGGCTALIQATINNDDRIVIALISRNDTKLDLQDANGKTALYHACACCFREISMTLLDNGADQNIQEKEFGRTALIQAIINDNDGIATALILHDDTKLDVQDVDGNTALHYACLKNKESIVCTLLFRRSDTTIKNSTGKTALECCTKFEIISFFKSYEQINKINIPTKKNKCVDTPKTTTCFNVPSNQSIIKIGTIGDYYQKWDETFMCWTKFKSVPKCDGVVLKCEYVDEKIQCHHYGGNGMIRFNHIYKEDGSVKNDIYC